MHFCCGTHLNFIVVKWMVCSQRTIESCFEKRCPIVFEDPLSTLVIFTDSCNSWVDSLPDILKLNCVFTKYKINKLFLLKCQHKISLDEGFCIFIFCRFPFSDLLSQKKTDKKDKVLQKLPFGTWKFGKIGVLVNFHWKLKFYKLLSFRLKLTF